MTHEVLITSVFLEPGDEVDRMLIAQGCRTVHAPHRGPSRRDPAELAVLVRTADAAIVAGEPFTRDVLAAAPDLKVIARTGAGYDSVDVDAATEHGITVCNQPGVNRRSVAEMTLLLLMMNARRVQLAVDGVRAGGWQRPQGAELHGSTLGLLGLGAIGKDVADIATALGVHVLAHDPYADEVWARQHGVELASLPEVLQRADQVSLHMPLTPATRHLLGAAEFALMKPTAYLVNTSRGPVVDEQALADAVRTGAIAGAALDVLEVEPLPTDSPLRTLDQVVVTPHLGGSTHQARARSGVQAAEQVLDALAGRTPAWAVNAHAAAPRPA